MKMFLLAHFLLVVFIVATSSESIWPTRSQINPSFSFVGDPSKKFHSSSIANPIKYRFTGAQKQFVMFRLWDFTRFKTSNSMLSFQFRTKNPSGFLMYLDDGGIANFLALMLNDGGLTLRFKCGEAEEVVFHLGSNLNNDRWHKVLLKVSHSSIELSINTSNKIRQTKRDTNCIFAPGTQTYFGGLSSSYKVQSLSLSVIYYFDKFVGEMKDFSMDGSPLTYVKKTNVEIESGELPCSKYRNPCLNGGICYVENRKRLCDCSHTNYSGDICDGTNRPSVASFRGSEWFSYDVSEEPLSSFDDTITLEFRTMNPDGLMLHTGKSADFINLSLKDGFVVLVVNLGSGAYEVVVQPDIGTFSDDRWHSINVTRRLRQVNIVVDRVHIANEIVQDDNTQLTLDDTIFVGGSPATYDLPGSKVQSNFVGCLKEVTYSNHKYRRLPMSRLASEHNQKIKLHGNVDFDCTSPGYANTVSFSTPDAKMKIFSRIKPLKGTIDFSFLTTEANGLMLYTNSTSRDLFAIELIEGELNVVISLGSGTNRFSVPLPNKLNDGKWHTLNVRRNRKNLNISLDGLASKNYITGANYELDISKIIYLGGIDFMSTFKTSYQIFTATMRQGYVGCLRDFRIDGQTIDLKTLSQDQTTSRGVVPYCKSSKISLCESNPCKNGAKCTEGMNRFICDCLDTSFTGESCEKAVVTASFNGMQAITFPLDTTVYTQSDFIALRFKTSISTGMLFATTSNTSKDSIRIELVKGGKIRVYVNIECSSKKNCTAPRQGHDFLYHGRHLNDGLWHKVKVTRRGKRVTLDVDGKLKTKNLLSDYNQLEFDLIHLGMLVSTPKKLASFQSSVGSFVGHLENVMFNNVMLIDSCADRSISCNNNSTFGNKNVIRAYPVSFDDKNDENSYVILPSMEAYSSMILFLSIKTSVTDGIILFNKGQNDFIAIELIDGKIYYVYNLGNGDKILTVSDVERVNDNKWHDIKITRSESNIHTMSVDGRTSSAKGSTRNKNLDLSGHLYIGGIRQDMIYSNNISNSIISRTGYQGCLANLDINGVVPDIFALPQTNFVGSVIKGCKTPSTVCKPDSCKNGGKCNQKWSNYVCDCSLTTFIGPHCNTDIRQVEDISYRFGPEPGIILYRWIDTYPSSRSDKFALRFSTTLRNAVLVRIVGSTDADIEDFLELTIEKGRITLRFNVGGDDVTVFEPKSVSDGQHHSCVVHRKWTNATLRVDNFPLRTNRSNNGGARARYQMAKPSIPIPAQYKVDAWLKSQADGKTVFNSQSLIQIGGVTDEEMVDSAYSHQKSSSSIRKPFQGQMSGFFFNDVRVFQLAAQNDPQVIIEGDVNLIRSFPPTSPTVSRPITTMATLTTFTETMTTEGTPVLCDDEDMCPNSSGSGDGSGQLPLPGEDELSTPKPLIRSVESTASQFTQTVNYPILVPRDSAKAQNPSLSSPVFSLFSNEIVSHPKSDYEVVSTAPPSNSFDETVVDPELLAVYADFTSNQLFYEYNNGKENLHAKILQAETQETKDKKLISTLPNQVASLRPKTVNSAKESFPSKTTSAIEIQDQYEASAYESFYTHNDHNNSHLSIFEQITSKKTNDGIKSNGTSNSKKLQTKTKKVELNVTKAFFVVEASSKHFVNINNSVDLDNFSGLINNNSDSKTTRDNTSKSFYLPFTESTFAPTALPPLLSLEARGEKNKDVEAKQTPSAGLNRTQTDLADLKQRNSTQRGIETLNSVKSDLETSFSETSTLQAPSFSPSSLALTKPSAPSSKLDKNLLQAYFTTHVLPVAENNINDIGGSSIISDKTAVKPTLTNEMNPISASTALLPNDVTDSALTNTSSASVVLAGTTTMTTAMIAGIAAAAGLCIFALLGVMYCYRTKDAMYSVDKNERLNGFTPANGKHVVVGANGTIIRGKTSIQNQDKEFYV